VSPRPRVAAPLVRLARHLRRRTRWPTGPPSAARLLWDDPAHVTAPALQSLKGLWRIWFSLGATQQYYPLLHSAFWIEHRLWGDAVLGYHLVNLAQHALAACLVVLIVRRLALPGAWLAGMVFALHPICVEAVAWISEQKSTLSAVFYLSSRWSYTELRPRPPPLVLLLGAGPLRPRPPHQDGNRHSSRSFAGHILVAARPPRLAP
jgi:hypothetical protein